MKLLVAYETQIEKTGKEVHIGGKSKKGIILQDSSISYKDIEVMITNDKITEIFCVTDEFSKKFDEEIENMPLLSSCGKARRRRVASMSDSEIMTIMMLFHFGTFDHFKHYYLHFIIIHLKNDFPDAVSYNRFVELESRVFFKMMSFLNLHSFGRCTGITFVDSTMIPVCHNLRRYANRLFDALFADGVHLVTGTRSNMKNRLMTLWDKIMLRKRYVIECINHLLKDKGNLVHSRHRAVNNFIMNLIAALGAYCFFDNKPEAIKGYRIEDNKQLSLF